MNKGNNNPLSSAPDAVLVARFRTLLRLCEKQALKFPLDRKGLWSRVIQAGCDLL